MRPDPAIDVLAERLVAARPDSRTLVTGLTGAVSAGKSTLALRLADRLTALGLSVEVISTDGFLKPNAVLGAEGALDLKGWPHTFDTPAMLSTLAQVPSGPVEIPVHSHVTYDIDPALTRRIDRPDILIAEGLNLHFRAETQAGADPLDLLVYLDADEADLEAWYVARFLGFWEAAEHDPTSFSARFRGWTATPSRASPAGSGRGSTCPTCASTSSAPGPWRTWWCARGRTTRSAPSRPQPASRLHRTPFPPPANRPRNTSRTVAGGTA